jgi:polar amino acid transport system substrate-binding protein
MLNAWFRSGLHRFIFGAGLAFVSITLHSQTATQSDDRMSSKNPVRSPTDSLVPPPICPHPIRVALYDIGPFFDPEHDKGIDKDVITALQEKTHCRFSYVFESRVRIWKMLANGALDMTVSGISNAARKEFADFVPYYHARNILIMRDEATLPISPDAFLSDNALKLGVVKSYIHGPGWDEWITKLKQNDRVIEIADTRDLFRQLDVGHVQAIPIWQPASIGMSERYPTQHRLVRLPWFADQAKVEYCLVLSKRYISPDLHKFIAENMAEMRKDGTLKKIFRHYMSEEDSNSMLLP